jgi:hypothetical protein
LLGEPTIPRNYGNGPGSFTVNMRISRSFQFGLINKTSVAPAKAPGATAAAPPAGGAKQPAGTSGPMAAGGGAGAKVAAVSPGGPAPQGGPSGEKRYNLTVSINFQNLLNNVNLGTPVGNLLSPSFGESVNLSGSFGGFGGGGSSGAGNRRIYAQVRLNF